MPRARTIWGALVISGVMATTPLHASGLSLTPCPTETLAYYQVNFSSPTVGAPDGPCANGILNFSGFTFYSSGSPPGDLAGNNQITLTPVSDESGDIGFSISGLSVQPDQTATYVIDWAFDIDAGPIASGASLGMDPPSGDVTITQDYCVDSYISAYSAGTPFCYGGDDSTPPPVQSLSVTPTSPNAEIIFDPAAYDFADVMTIITLVGTDTEGAGYDTVSGTSAISPEPGTLLLIPIGLLMIRFVRRRPITQ